MTDEIIIKLFEQRREEADKQFHQKLEEFMRKYNIPLNQLNEIGIISWIDIIQERRQEMILWNNRCREERNRR